MRAAAIDLPLAGGVRQDIHRQMLPNGALSQATNVRIRKQGGLSLRKGYEAIGRTVSGSNDKDGNATPTAISGTALRMVSHANELLLLTTKGLWAYQESLDRWAFRGDIGRFAAPTREILDDSNVYQLRAPGVAYANGYTLSCYKAESTSSCGIWAELRRVDDGLLIFRAVVASGASATELMFPRVCASGTTLGVFWVDTATNALRGAVVDTASVPNAMGASAFIANFAAGNTHFDVCAHPTSGFVFAYELAAGGSIRVTRYTTALVFVAGHSRVTAVNPNRVSVCQDGTNIFVAWLATASGQAQAFILDTSLSLVAADTAIGAASADNKDVAVVSSGTVGTCLVYYTGYPASGQPYFKSHTFNTSAAVGSVQEYYGVALVSRPFALTDGSLFAIGCTRTETTRSYFIVGATETTAKTRWVHGRFALNLAPMWEDTDHISDVASLGSDAFMWAGRVINRGLVTASDALCRAEMFSFSATSSERCDVAQLGESLYIANGTLVRYDGFRVKELNFHQEPEIISATPSNGAGALTVGGSYSYVVTYERKDRNGQRHQSPPSTPVTMTTGGSDDTGTLSIGDYKLYSFEGSTSGYVDAVAVQVWRTTNGGTIYRRCSPDLDPPYTSGWPYSNELSFTDTMSDTTLLEQEILYTEGGVLPHATNIPCKYLAASRDRLWIAGLEDVTCAQASKIYVAGEPVQFADDEAFRVRIPEPITAIASMDGALVIFSRNGAWIVQGEGPDDKGIGTFSAPERLPVSSGCIDHRSLVVFRDGLAFRSARGLELIPRGFGAPVWFGRPVQSDTDDYYVSVSSACVFPEEGLLKFSLGLGDTTRKVVNYDYENGQWITDSPANGGVVECMAAHRGTMYLCTRTPSDSNGIFREGTGYADFSSGYTATIITGDIRVAGLTGFQRLRQIDLLGEYKDACSLAISTVFPVVGQTDSISKSMTGTSGDPVRLSWRPSMQKCDTFRISVAMSNASSSEGLVINGLTLHVLRLPGSGRLDASRRL